MMISRVTIIAVAFLAVLSIAEIRTAHGLAGYLITPQISIPVDADGVQDPVVSAVQKVLSNHQNQFIEGSFINAHSNLHFKGDAGKLSSILKELCEVKGALISVMFSKEAVAAPLLKAENPGLQPFDWSIDHNGWNDPEQLVVTINTQTIKIEELALPVFRGVSPSTEK